MKLICTVNTETAIYDDNGAVVYARTPRHSGLYSEPTEERIVPEDFRHRMVDIPREFGLSSAVGGQHIDAVEKFYGIYDIYGS